MLDGVDAGLAEGCLWAMLSHAVAARVYDAAGEGWTQRPGNAGHGAVSAAEAEHACVTAAEAEA